MRGGASHRRTRMRRAQVFSLDLLVAAMVLAFTVGAALQLHESAQRSFAADNSGNSNAAEAVADALSAGTGLDALPDYCFGYSNGTGNCTGFSCPGGSNTFAARRIMNCTGGTCALEVRTCGD